MSAKRGSGRTLGYRVGGVAGNRRGLGNRLLILSRSNTQGREETLAGRKGETKTTIEDRGPDVEGSREGGASVNY